MITKARINIDKTIYLWAMNVHDCRLMVLLILFGKSFIHGREGQNSFSVALLGSWKFLLNFFFLLTTQSSEAGSVYNDMNSDGQFSSFPSHFMSFEFVGVLK